MPDTPSCLLLEVRLKGLSGFALQDEMRKRQIRAPIIFLTAHGDVPMSVRALKAGAFDFLCKPCPDQKLIETVFQALLTDAERLHAKRSMDILQKQYGSLTSRQRQVMSWVAHGFMNKQIAHGMGVSEVTVKTHRMAAMKKMDASGVPDFVRKALMLGVQAPEQPSTDLQLGGCR
jgi:FixJ family two-component response regulator